MRAQQFPAKDHRRIHRLPQTGCLPHARRFQRRNTRSPLPRYSHPERPGLQQMGKKIVEAVDPEKAKEALLAVLDGKDIYEEILGPGAAQGPQMPRKRRARRKKNVGGDGTPQEV